MKHKRIVLALFAGVLSAAAAFPSLAGVWKHGSGTNSARWWYDNEDGTWLNNGWYWLDGDKNGVAECYYFDAEGWLTTASIVTPGDYTVDENGAWTVDGVVQTKRVPVASQQSDEDESWEDFQSEDEDEEDEERTSSKKKPSAPDFSQGDSERGSGGGPADEATESGGDEKPQYSDKPNQSPESGYQHSSVKDLDL